MINEKNFLVFDRFHLSGFDCTTVRERRARARSIPPVMWVPLTLLGTEKVALAAVVVVGDALTDVKNTVEFCFVRIVLKRFCNMSYHAFFFIT